MGRRHNNSYIIEKADRFHQVHNPKFLVPVPIEIIAEFKLLFVIQPEPGLKEAVGPLMSYLASEARTIVVDEALFKKGGPEYRTCLAHEYAHFVLHWDHVELRSAKTLSEWKQRYKQIPDSVYSRMEEEAAILAGLILVPTGPLVHHFNQSIRQHNAEAGPISNGDKKNIINELCAKFEVPPEVMLQRIAFERLWD